MEGSLPPGLPPDVAKMLMKLMANMPTVTCEEGIGGQSWNSMCTNHPEDLPRNWLEFSKSCGITDFNLIDCKEPSLELEKLLKEGNEDIDLGRVKDVSIHIRFYVAIINI